MYLRVPERISFVGNVMFSLSLERQNSLERGVKVFLSYGSKNCEHSIVPREEGGTEGYDERWSCVIHAFEYQVKGFNFMQQEMRIH